MVDFACQRKNMVESQVRPADITDRRIVGAMGEVPREAFVPDAVRSLAYMDGEVRLSAATTGRSARAMVAPRTLAKMIELAAPSPGDVVLDVGAGTGYSAAVLSSLCERVLALEADAELARAAGEILAKLSLDNVTVVQGPLPKGWPAAAPYAVILVEGAIAEPPAELLAQLAEGGRLVAVVGDHGAGKAVVWRRQGALFDRRVAFDAAAPSLPGFERSLSFQL